MQPPAAAIRIRGVTKTFGPKVAVRDLDLEIPMGSLCGFIGPNGAGKTTTIRMIMSIIFPDGGEISVLDKPSALDSKDRIGYLPEERGLYRKMRVLAFLTYIARLKGVDAGDARRRALLWLDRVGLKDSARKKCEELSKGMQQKVQFVAAIIHEPDLIILDEVFSGLDPLNRILMRQLIQEQHGQGRTIIFSTHAMYEAEQLCDRIFMIDRGVKVLDSTISDIRRRFDPRTVVVEPLDHLLLKPENPVHARAVHALQTLPGVHRVVHSGSDFHVGLDTPPKGVMTEIMRAMDPLGGVRRIELKQTTLEEVFIAIVQAGGRELSDAELASLSANGALSHSGSRMGGES